VLYYGALYDNKGADVLVEAIPRIRKNIPDTQFVFAPRHAGKIEESMKNRLKTLGCDKECKFVHSIPIEEYVAMADVITLPYINILGTEGNPSCLLEGAASKTPVVTTKIKEIQEIMKKDTDVLMAKPGDPKSLAKSIIKVLKDDVLSKRITEHAFIQSKEFDIKIIGKQFEDLYKEKKC